MTTENLARALELKTKIDTYNNFISLFLPGPYSPSELDSQGNVVPLAGLRPKVALVAGYDAGHLDVNGNTVGNGWSIVSASLGGMPNNKEILDIINEIATDELATIGADIITAVTGRITLAQTEFDNL